MNVAALLKGNTISFYDYTRRTPPYNGIIHRRLRRLRCHVMRNIGSNETTYFIPQQNEGVLAASIQREAEHLFKGVSLEAMILYLIDVYRGKRKKVPGYSLAMHPVPCFVEDGIFFSQSEVYVRQRVKMMR